MKRFLFSTHASLETQEMLKGLRAAHFLTVTSCMLVCTEDELVAALLEKLDTAEAIETVVSIETPPAHDEETSRLDVSKPQAAVKRDRRRYSSGEMVECKVCHRMVYKAQLCKTGECKPCRMTARKLEKSQAAEKSQGYSALPARDYGPQDSIADYEARPRETIKLSGLKGRKVA